MTLPKIIPLFFILAILLVLGATHNHANAKMGMHFCLYLIRFFSQSNICQFGKVETFEY